MEEFPDSSRAVVELALETCAYDETKARQLLATFNAKTTSVATTSSGGASAPVDSRVSITVTAATSSSAATTSSADTGHSAATPAVVSSTVSTSDVMTSVSTRPRSVITTATATRAGSAD